MKFKKILVTILTFVMILALCPTVSAQSDPSFVISNGSAKPGETVTVNLSISNNPGIMAMTFSVVYDKDNLEFISYTKGWISSPTYKDHADKGFVVFTVLESSAKTNVGSIMSLTFKIKDDAKPGKYNIILGNHFYESDGKNLSNCFSNDKESYYTNVKVKTGIITIQGPCYTSGHKFGVWTTIKESDCDEMGIKERTCTVCGEIEQKKLTFVHDFEDEWTVDRVATPEQKGIMTRHCKLCDATTDRIIFSYEEIQNPDDTEKPDDSTDGDTTNPDYSTDTPNDSTDADKDNTSSKNEETQKPIIDNTEGGKNPIEEVGKLEDFENLPPPVEPEEESTDEQPVTDPEENTSSNQDASSSTSASNSDTKVTKDPTFFKTPIGIITIVLCVLLSGAIIAFGIMLILKNKKDEETE